MNFLEALKKLEDSEDFKRWKKDHRDMYLVHGFTMLGNSKEGPMNWQIGYYDQKDDKITPIDVGSGINIGSPQQAFKKNDSIKELEVKNIKISLKEALNKNEEARLEKFAKETPMKIFVIIQDLDEGQVWNITTATNTMNTINTKIDSSTGEIISIKTENFMQMK